MEDGANDLLFANSHLTDFAVFAVGIIILLSTSGLQGFIVPCGCFQEIVCQALIDRMLQAVLHPSAHPAF